MKSIFQKLFNKSEDENFVLNENAEYRFVLKYREISIGELYTKGGFWYFRYTEEFKQNTDKLYGIFGFDDLDKTYKSEYLWPFFKTRIPGLKQPKIREIIELENLSYDDEASLLKRFGRKTISNSYILESL